MGFLNTAFAFCVFSLVCSALCIVSVVYLSYTESPTRTLVSLSSPLPLSSDLKQNDIELTEMFDSNLDTSE